MNQAQFFMPQQPIGINQLGACPSNFVHQEAASQMSGIDDRQLGNDFPALALSIFRFVRHALAF